MKKNSIWNKSIEHLILTFSSLKGSTHSDVVIIGAGITGLSTAQILIEKGFDVIILEENTLCDSSSSLSNGTLSIIPEKGLFEIKKSYDLKIVKTILQARKDGLSQIESNIKKFSIDCDFEKVPWNFYSATKDLEDIIYDEFVTIHDTGFPVSRGPTDNLIYPIQSVIHLEDQAQFHPMKYELGLTRAICNSCRIYEKTEILNIQEERDQNIINTPEGKITTKYLILANEITNGMHSLSGPYQEQYIAFRSNKKIHPKGIYCGLYNDNETFISRSYELDGETYIIISEGAHKSANDYIERNLNLQNFSRYFFDYKEIDFAWSAQQYRPADLLPHIGRTSRPSIFKATGFFNDALLWAPISAQLISDEITNHKNQYAKIFSYSRFTPIRTAGNFLKENLHDLGPYFSGLTNKHNSNIRNKEKMGERNDQ